MSKILIIDDDESTRTLLRLIMEEAGYYIVEAEDGNKGIKLFRENTIDLVITDIIMPEKEGIETIIDLRKMCQDIIIIAISASSSHALPYSYLDMAEKFGAQMILDKPINKEKLLTSVKTLLN